MELRGVLFDFSGTLFRLEFGADVFDGLTSGSGAPLDQDDRLDLMRRLTAPVGISAGLPEELHEAWGRRDLDAAIHRTVYVAALRATGISAHGMAESLYDRMCRAGSWQPYPDTVEALTRVRAAGIPAAVVSNIGWDITAVFDHHGATGLIDRIVMSYREGHVKPDPELFAIACARLGVPPEHTLMIGDSEEADGGAASLGIKVAIVDPLPTAQRRDALLSVLAAHGIG
ncbi:MAG: HAD-IA family hydrolase [Kutzneria sp.]|nr:HAD-IA family hydrolase [Kutzneria sp.]MBV9847372.1 HAD-IA family hydrolase [Kutzneria sp.]